MRHTIKTAAILLAMTLSTAAFAEGRDWSKPETSARAEASPETNVNVETGAAAFGGGATITEERQAPSLGGLALGGGHPCAYSPATAQISLIGGGAGIGGMKVDSACMLMVMGAAGDTKAYKASQLMLAARDPAACEAMEQAGLLQCVTKEERRAAKASTVSSKSAAGWGAKCQLNGRQLVFQPTSKAARGAELQACKARYGL